MKGNDVVELEASETIRFFGYGGILMMDFVADENAFMHNYSEFGIFILPNYIMKYFENENKLDTQSRTATRILELINTLDPIEKQSLATCLEERIKNLDEKNRNNTYAFPISFPTGAAAVAASAVTGLILESIPASVFAGGIVLFGKKKYDEYYNNQREEY